VGLCLLRYFSTRPSLVWHRLGCAEGRSQQQTLVLEREVGVRRADDGDQDEISAEAGESWCGGTQGARAVMLLSPTFMSPRGSRHTWAGGCGPPACDGKVGGCAGQRVCPSGSASVPRAAPAACAKDRYNQLQPHTGDAVLR